MDEGRGAVQGHVDRWCPDLLERPDATGVGRVRGLRAPGELPGSSALERRLRRDGVRRRSHLDEALADRHPADGANRCHGSVARQRCGAFLDRAELDRRQRDQRLPDHAVHRRHCADARRHRVSGHEPHGDRTDERDRLHLPGRGDQRRRNGPRFHCVSCDHSGARDRAGCSDCRHGRAERRLRDRGLDSTRLGRRKVDHELHDHSVHRLDRADTDHGGRRWRDRAHGDRAHERHCLYVQSRCDERRGHRPSVGRVQRCHTEAGSHPVHERRLLGPARPRAPARARS